MQKQRKEGQHIGTDTSNATATASDIAYGKTAYARGQLLVGTLRNTEVEEYYKLDVNGYDNETQSIINTDPVTEDVISSRSNLVFSKNLDYCVSVTQLNNVTSTKYIESYAINDNGMYIQESANGSGEITVKKYRYTFEELGIPTGATIEDIQFGAPGLGGYDDRCLLVILYKTSYMPENGSGYRYKHEIRALTYHLTDNGHIGKAYDTEQNVVDITQVIVDNLSSNSEMNRYSCLLAMPNNNPNIFFIYEQYDYNTDGHYKLYRCYIMENSNNCTLTNEELEGAGVVDITSIIFTKDDQYICGNVHLIKINTSSYITVASYYDGSNNVNLNNIPNTNKFIRIYCNSYYVNAYLYEITVSGNTLNYSLLKTITLKNKSGASYSFKFFYMPPDGQYLIVGAYNSASNVKGTEIFIFEMEDIDSAENDATVQPILENQVSYNIYYSAMNVDGSKILIANSTNMNKLISSIDNSEIIAIKYKDKYYYKQEGGQLSAGQGDVRAGKTFIGYQGYPEIGTMEVTE